MKLVELLARELDEWPEGAAIVVQDYDGEVKYQFSNEEPKMQGAAVWIRPPGGEPNDGIMFRAILASDHTTAIVTREMWEAERAKLASKTEWDGEGLPPVGTVCEAHDYGKYRTVSIVAHDGEHALCRVGQGEYMAGNSGSFRPIRTQEQIAAQEREQAITDLIQTTCIRRGEAAIIYDAGYRKQEKSE